MLLRNFFRVRTHCPPFFCHLNNPNNNLQTAVNSRDHFVIYCVLHQVVVYTPLHLPLQQWIISRHSYSDITISKAENLLVQLEIRIGQPRTTKDGCLQKTTTSYDRSRREHESFHRLCCNALMIARVLLHTVAMMLVLVHRAWVAILNV